MTRKTPRPPDYWTRERILGAIRRWNREKGAPPTLNDWMRAGSYWPSGSTVRRVFITWNAALTEAGFKTRPAGRPASAESKRKIITADPVSPTAAYETLMQRMSVMESNLTRQMAELRIMLDRQKRPVESNGNGHTIHEPNLLERILGKAA